MSKPEGEAEGATQPLTILGWTLTTPPGAYPMRFAGPDGQTMAVKPPDAEGDFQLDELSSDFRGDEAKRRVYATCLIVEADGKPVHWPETRQDVEALYIKLGRDRVNVVLALMRFSEMGAEAAAKAPRKAKLSREDEAAKN